MGSGGIVAITGGGGGAMVILYVGLVGVPGAGDAEAVTETLKLNDPNGVGVPEMIPVLDRVNPVGSKEPVASIHV